MPWKERRPMELRREFVLAASALGANVTQLCRDFGISRNNGYKWLRRYKAQGELGLEDQSRRPRTTNGTSGETVLRLLELRHRYPKWGAKKMQALLISSGHKGTPPSIKTIARIFDRAGEPRSTQAQTSTSTRASRASEARSPRSERRVDRRLQRLVANDGRQALRAIDRSRCVQSLCALSSNALLDGAVAVKPAFERLFQAHGLPKVIRVDNGAPFACTSAPAGLSRLSAWWTSLGIRVSFSRPAHPQDNGSHERMHADMANAIEADPAGTPELSSE